MTRFINRPGPAGSGGLGGSGFWVGAGFLAVIRSSLVGNEAIGGAGVAIGSAERPAGAGWGCGAYQTDGTLAFEESFILANRATGGAGSPAGDGIGGGLYIARGSACGRKIVVEGNDASTSDPDIFGPFESC